MYALLFLFSAAVMVYWPILDGRFLMLWDDQWVAMNSYTEAGFTATNIWRVLTEFYEGQYAPMNELTYITLYALVGYDPFWFHLTSLVIHIINVGLVYFFIKRLLRLAGGFSLSARQRIAFITALLLAVHPFTVESVAWISASKTIIYVLFYLVALLFYLKYTQGKKIMFYLLTILFFIISFGGKEQAVVLPLCLLLVDNALKRDLRSYKIWLEKIPFFLLALFFGIVTLLSHGPIDLTAENTGYPFYQRIVFACYTLIEYLSKCLLPVKLSYIYPFPNQIGEPLPVRFWFYPAALILLIASLWSFWRRKWIFFGVTFFVIHIAVTLHIISLSRFAIVADRYVYLSAVGVFFIIACFINKGCTHEFKYRKAVVPAFVIYLASIGVYAHTRTYVWHDVYSLKKELREQLQEREDYRELMKKHDY